MRHLFRSEGGNRNVSMCGVLVWAVEADESYMICGRCVAALLGNITSRIKYADS